MRKVELGDITLYNADCMDLLKQMPDNAFDLAICDPPFGEDGVNRSGGSHNEKLTRFNLPPQAEYFEQLRRVSKNQIIWGANYFPNMPPTRCFVVWRKLTISESFSMAMAEYAWTSFDENAKVFECAPQGKANDKRWHPTAKPIALYKWLLSNYAKEGDKILDTHLGSGSIAIACHDLGFSLTGIELDEEYFAKAVQRIKEHQRQLKLF